MPAANLTTQFLDEIKESDPPEKLTLFFDQEITGFILEWRATGGLSYYFRYPIGNRKMRMIKIAKERDISLSEARGQAYLLRREFLAGNEPTIKRMLGSDVPLLKDFINEQYLPSAKVRKRSWRLDETALNYHFIPKFGQRRMDTITRAEMEAQLESLIKSGFKPVSVNRYLITIKSVYSTAVRWQVLESGKNPCAGISPFPTIARRERFLTQVEAMRLLRVLDGSRNWRVALSIKLILLTGARKREILDARWDYINAEARVLTLPNSKSGHPRHIALSDAALSLLARLPREDNVPWLFFNPQSKQPLNNLHPAWVNLRTQADLPDLRIHDLRHSFASFLVNHGRSLYEVQGLLGHQSPRTTMRYAHLASSRMVEAANLVGSIVSGDC